MLPVCLKDDFKNFGLNLIRGTRLYYVLSCIVICVRNFQVESRIPDDMDGAENGQSEHEESPIVGGADGGPENEIIELAGNDEVSNASIYLDLENGYKAGDGDTSIVVSGEAGEARSNRRHRRTEVELLGANVCKGTLRSGRLRDSE